MEKSFLTATRLNQNDILDMEFENKKVLRCRVTKVKEIKTSEFPLFKITIKSLLCLERS